jgi:diacylglycerol kinase (ATP)
VRCVLIHNPASGHKRDLRAGQLDQVVDALSLLGHSVETMATTAPGSAAVQARDAALGGADIIFACGGDGTIHEVIQGLVSETGEPAAALGIIPLGSANALARHLRIPLDPMKAALQEIQGTPQTIPIGKVSYGSRSRYFIVMAGAGPDGALVYDLLTVHKSSFGRLAYYLHAARLFSTRRFRPFEIEYTDKATGLAKTQEAVSAMAVRVEDLGGLFSKLAGRNASIMDAHLRLLILSPPGALSLPLSFVSGWLNLHSFNPLLRFVDATAFSCRPLSSPAPHFQADGEWLGRIPMRVSIVPNALRLLLPREKGLVAAASRLERGQI